MGSQKQKLGSKKKNGRRKTDGRQIEIEQMISVAES